MISPGIKHHQSRSLRDRRSWRPIVSVQPCLLHGSRPQIPPDMDVTLGSRSNTANHTAFARCACHEYGCPRFRQADVAMHERPPPTAGYDIMQSTLWRQEVCSAMHRPALGFPLLAGGIRDILKGNARQNSSRLLPEASGQQTRKMASRAVQAVAISSLPVIVMDYHRR